MADTTTPTPMKPKYQIIIEALKSPVILALVTVMGSGVSAYFAAQQALGSKPPVEKLTIAPADPVSKPAGEHKIEAVRTELGELKRIAAEIRDRLPAKPEPRIRPLK